MNDLNNGRIHRISISRNLGEKKINVPRARLIALAGIEGDAHFVSERPLSLLPLESFGKLSHPDLDIKPGDFAENITTIGLDFNKIAIGCRLLLGTEVEIEIIQIGKECHTGCSIRDYTGDCIMPREGVFAKVITGGELIEGDSIRMI